MAFFRGVTSILWPTVGAITVLIGFHAGNAETLVCVPFPAAAVNDLDYDRLSGDWREIRKTQAPLSGLRGRWRLNFLDNKFDYHAAFMGNHSCAPAIKGDIVKVLPKSQYELQYNFFGQPVKETLTVVATDYDTYAVIYRCEDPAAPGPCPPHSVHVTVLARHPLDESTAPEIRKALRRICVPEHSLANLEDTGGECEINQESDPTAIKASAPAGTENCLLPLDTGFCQAKVSSFYYSQATGKCEPFTYTGCGGNSNNFQSLNECLDKCQTPLQANVAVTASSEVGTSNCSNTASCGLSCPSCCSRNQNTECIVCDCQLPGQGPRLRPASCLLSPSDCPPECQSSAKSDACFECSCPISNGTLVPALEYVPAEQPFFCPPTCMPKITANGERKCHCTDNAVCSLPLDEGSCDENIPRYFFNTTSSRCDVFQYKGCTGNANNFESHEDCLAECEDLCHLPKDSGACTTDEPKDSFYYNSQTGRCEAFVYTGCGGNENRFDDIDSCRIRCEDSKSKSFEPPVDRALCHLPLDEGSCDDTESLRETRYFYDAQKEECISFVYAGCGGNDNNFRLHENCNLTCFGVQTLVLKAEASCTETECDCGKYRMDGGCKVCECGNGAVKSNAEMHISILLLCATVSTKIFW